VATNSTKKNSLPTKNGAYYSWKQGNVFYTKNGSGNPILLIHDTNSASSSVEWSKIIKRLQRNHTVYTIDLLGCGLSDKPGVSYTNYMYVQLITAFIKNVIGQKVNVVASNMSSSFVIMANHMDDSIIEKMIFINPISMDVLENVPDNQSKMKQTLINLPLVGTFLYNVLTSPCRIDHLFRSIYYAKSQLICTKAKDAFYESAHMDNSNGKYLYSSILGNYMNANIRHAIKKCTKPIYIIGSKDIKNNVSAIEKYHKLNPNIEVTYISNCRLYPHLENPEKTYQIIQSSLSK
jgi:pimeloyl-ACP methyl ester carboxylesterase